MMKGLSMATVISVVGLISIGLIGTIYGYDMLRDNFLVGLVPIVSSVLLVIFGSLSLFVKDAQIADRAEVNEEPFRSWAAPAVMLLLIIYLLAVDLVGFDLDTAALILFVFLAAGVRRPVTIGLTLAVLFAVAFLFQSILGIELPRGAF